MKLKQLLFIKLSQLLLGTIITFLPMISFSQKNNLDTVAFKKDFEKLLKQYGIEGKDYLINVASINQKGGQTAFIINNNYYGDPKQRHIQDSTFDKIVAEIRKINKSNPHFDSSKVEVYSLPLQESQKLAIELKKKLQANNFTASVHHNLVGVKELEWDYDIMPGNDRCVVVIVQPLKEGTK